MKWRKRLTQECFSKKVSVYRQVSFFDFSLFSLCDFSSQTDVAFHFYLECRLLRLRSKMLALVWRIARQHSEPNFVPVIVYSTKFMKVSMTSRLRIIFERENMVVALPII